MADPWLRVTAPLRLRVTATVRNTKDGTRKRLRNLRVTRSGSTSRNEALESKREGPHGEFRQIIVHESLYGPRKLAAEVRYEDSPEDLRLKLDMRWIASCSQHGYFRLSVGHCDPPSRHAPPRPRTYHSDPARRFNVHAGRYARIYVYEDDTTGWSIHLKMEAFHERDHDHWCSRVEEMHWMA